MEQQTPIPALKRDLGLPEVTLSGVGIILGAGVYVLIGQAARLARQCNLARVWFISDNGIAHGPKALRSFPPCSPKPGRSMIMSRMPSMYQLAFVIGWLVFLPGVLAAATVALGFAGYFSALTSIPGAHFCNCSSHHSYCTSCLWCERNCPGGSHRNTHRSVRTGYYHCHRFASSLEA